METEDYPTLIGIDLARLIPDPAILSCLDPTELINRFSAIVTDQTVRMDGRAFLNILKVNRIDSLGISDLIVCKVLDKVSNDYPDDGYYACFGFDDDGTLFLEVADSRVLKH